MSRSERVSLRDIARAFRLIHEARDVGGDPQAWPAVVTAGLTELLGAEGVALTRVEFGEPGTPLSAEAWADVKWDSDAQRDDWIRRFKVLQEFRRCPVVTAFLDVSGRLSTRSREQLMVDADWYRSPSYNELYRPFGLDQVLYSFAVDPVGRARLGFGMNRRKAARPFGARERRLLRIFHRELIPHIGRSLVRPGRPEAPLPARLRRTLDCLLEGDSAGQVALRLGLSRHTVHEYIADLYCHYGVRSRAQLLARCLGTGPERRAG